MSCEDLYKVNVLTTTKGQQKLQCEGEDMKGAGMERVSNGGRVVQGPVLVRLQ